MVYLLSQTLPGSAVLTPYAHNSDILFNLKEAAHQTYDGVLVPSLKITSNNEIVSISFITRVNSILYNEDYPIDNIVLRESNSGDVRYNFTMNVNLLTISLHEENLLCSVAKITDYVVECKIHDVSNLTFLVELREGVAEFKNEKDVYIPHINKHLTLGDTVVLTVNMIHQIGHFAIAFGSITDVIPELI